MNDTRPVIGVFERVVFPDFGGKEVIAKIDTGAYSGALHATNIIESVGTDGIKRLTFQPFGLTGLTTSTTEYRPISVMSSNGQVQTRYVIKTVVNINSVSMPMNITLSDRTIMRMEVLIGRQFLQNNNFVVDVNQGAELNKIKGFRQA